MFLWAWIELSLMIILPLFFITQIIIPAWKNTPTFPLFRRTYIKRRRINEKIEELKMENEGVDLEKAVILLQKEISIKKEKMNEI